mmetsp:Transcript_116063/g.237364  ORF Transcript_116063/g.237364 Transcript_116063/m.237364 type:complete len:296 (+) Transcript_116063:594-1481(+)
MARVTIMAISFEALVDEALVGDGSLPRSVERGSRLKCLAVAMIPSRLHVHPPLHGRCLGGRRLHNRHCPHGRHTNGLRLPCHHLDGRSLLFRRHCLSVVAEQVLDRRLSGRLQHDRRIRIRIRLNFPQQILILRRVGYTDSEPTEELFDTRHVQLHVILILVTMLHKGVLPTRLKFLRAVEGVQRLCGLPETYMLWFCLRVHCFKCLSHEEAGTEEICKPFQVCCQALPPRLLLRVHLHSDVPQVFSLTPRIAAMWQVIQVYQALEILQHWQVWHTRQVLAKIVHARKELPCSFI